MTSLLQLQQQQLVIKIICVRVMANVVPETPSMVGTTKKAAVYMSICLSVDRFSQRDSA